MVFLPMNIRTNKNRNIVLLANLYKHANKFKIMFKACIGASSQDKDSIRSRYDDTAHIRKVEQEKILWMWVGLAG